MQAQQLNVEVISHNIANMNTTGYKRQRAEFQDMLYQNMERPGSTSSASGAILPLGIQIGVGVRADAVGRITEQGSITADGQSVRSRDQRARLFPGHVAFGANRLYARRQSRGQRRRPDVTADGYPVEPAITVPQEATAVQITRDGVVEATSAGQSDPQQIGQLELAAFINPAGLEAIGDNLFLETPASGSPNVATPGSPGIGTLDAGLSRNLER